MTRRSKQSRMAHLQQRIETSAKRVEELTRSTLDLTKAMRGLIGELKAFSARVRELEGPMEPMELAEWAERFTRATDTAAERARAVVEEKKIGRARGRRR